MPCPPPASRLPRAACHSTAIAEDRSQFRQRFDFRRHARQRLLLVFRSPPVALDAQLLADLRCQLAHRPRRDVDLAGACQRFGRGRIRFRHAGHPHDPLLDRRAKRMLVDLKYRTQREKNLGDKPSNGRQVR
jgi:hypothetical protein